MTIPLFRGRACVAMLMAVGFVLLAVSGVILYAAPHGRASGAWEILFLNKREWQNVHIVFGLLFIIAGVFHIWLNLTPLLNYVRQRLINRETGEKRNRYGLEPLLALLLAVFLVAASVVPFPPASTLLKWREAVVNLWQLDGMSGPGQGQGRGGAGR